MGSTLTKKTNSTLVKTQAISSFNSTNQKNIEEETVEKVPKERASTHAKNDDNDDNTNDGEVTRQKEENSARLIQRSFRRRKTSSSLNCALIDTEVENEVGKFLEVFDEECQESSFTESFDNFQNEIEETKWLAEKQIESALMNSSAYKPKTLVLVSSNLKTTPYKLKTTAQKDVDVIIYDFHRNTLADLLDSIIIYLNEEVKGTKLKSIAFSLQGGPGHFYLCKQVAFTKQKVSKNVELRRFLKTLAEMMSKLDTEACTIDFIVKDFHKDRSGAVLLKTIQSLMYPNKVKVQGIGDISEESLELLEKYFEQDLYKCWYQERSITRSNHRVEH